MFSGSDNDDEEFSLKKSTFTDDFDEEVVIPPSEAPGVENSSLELEPFTKSTSQTPTTLQLSTNNQASSFSITSMSSLTQHDDNQNELLSSSTPTFPTTVPSPTSFPTTALFTSPISFHSPTSFPSSTSFPSPTYNSSLPQNKNSNFSLISTVPPLTGTTSTLNDNEEIDKLMDNYSKKISIPKHFDKLLKKGRKIKRIKSKNRVSHFQKNSWKVENQH